MAKVAEAQVRLTLADRLTAPLRRIQARLSALSARLGFDRIGRAAGQLGRNIGNLGSALGQTTGRLSAFMGLLGAGGAGAVFGAFKLAQSTAAVGDEIAKTSRQLGIGAEALQEYRYAAEMSGVSTETLEASMKKFGVNAADAVSGNKAMRQEFKSLGIQLTDTSGNMRDMDAIFNDAVAAIASIESPMERSRAAMKLFGRAGVDMTRLFEIGADGVAELREEARKTGHVMSQQAAEFGEVFGDNVTRLQKRIEGFKNLLGVHLMPVMNEMVVGLTAWIDANGQLVRSTIIDWAKRFSEVLRDLMDPTSDLRQNIADIVQGFSDWLDRIAPVVDFLGGPLQTALAAVAFWIGAPLLTALALVTASFIKLGLVIATTPIGWILMGVAALAASVYVLYQEWDSFVAYWGDLWGRITRAFDSSWQEGIVAVLKEFNPAVHVMRGMNAVFEYFTGIDLIEEGSALAASFMEGVESIGADLATWIGEKIDAAVATIRGFGAAIYDAGAGLIRSLWDGVLSMWGEFKSWFAGAMADLLPSWTPNWIRDRLGFTGAPSGEAAPGSPAPAAITAPAAPAAPIVVPPTGARLGAPVAAPQAPTVTPQDVITDRVNAAHMEADSATFPEPLLVHEPQSIDASITIQSLTVQGGQGTPAEIKAAVSAAIAAEARRNAAATQSALSD